MGIESIKNIKRKDDITHLRNKGVNDNDCCERLSDLMYEQWRYSLC